MTPWIEILVTVPAAAIDLVTSELVLLGSAGVTVEERALDTFIPPDPNELPEGEQQLKAYFECDDTASLLGEVDALMQRLAPFYPDWRTVSAQAVEVGAQDWAQGWKQHFSAVRIGHHLVVRPSWEEFAAQEDDIVVVLDPGMAFGTGTHGTTRLCLEAVAEAFDSAEPPRRVLDVGTGSGILAIAAAALGAERVLACDIEEQALLTSRENCEVNHVEQTVELTGAPLEELDVGFDLILANILAEENVRLADPLIERLAPGALLVLSGILQEKEGFVRQAFDGRFAQPPQITHREEWSCLVYRR